MADLEDSDNPDEGESTGRSGTRGRRGAGASVTWRGIIDEPMPGDPPKHPRMAAIGRGLDGALVAVGLRRGRDDDGTLLPRKTGRLVAIVAGLFLVALGVSMLHVVPAGNVLVPITLGDAQSQEGQGLHVTLPWPITQVASMSVQIQNYTMSQGNQKGTDNPVLVLGSDGASGTVDATVQYKLKPSQATSVYVNLGKSFGPKFVQPASRACVRAEFENFTMVDAATTQAKAVSDGISDCIRKAIQPEGITLQTFQMRQVVLASQVQSSINSKIQAQQNQQSQVYNVQAAVAKAAIQRLQALATVAGPAHRGLRRHPVGGQGGRPVHTRRHAQRQRGLPGAAADRAGARVQLHPGAARPDQLAQSAHHHPGQRGHAGGAAAPGRLGRDDHHHQVSAQRSSMTAASSSVRSSLVR